jgi:hypothetical protein
MQYRWLAFGLISLAGAIYFALLVRSSLRDGEVARFTGGVSIGLLADMAADAVPEFRWLKYITRDKSPVRFWIAVAIRCLLVVMAIGFLAAAIIT